MSPNRMNFRKCSRRENHVAILVFKFHAQQHLSLIFVMTYKHKLSSRHEQEFGKLNLERQKLRSCDKTKDLLLNHTLKMMYKDFHSKLINNFETPF